jgi:4,5-dihydroxyphthalate decarboxylase
VANRPAAEAGCRMSGVEITVASWDYDRVRPLLDGRVRIEGCRANFLVLNPEECFHRAYLHQEFDVSEIGFSPYLIALSRGKNPYQAIPVFLSRMFRHSAIYIRSDRGIRSPADLKGRRIGVPEYQMSAALWARGMIHDEHHIRYDEMRWVQGGLEEPGRKDKFELNLPPGFPLEAAPAGRSLSHLLAAGDLDAVISARAPSCYLDSHPHVGRMFEDFRTAEREYFQRTGIFPIMHALGIRNDIVAKHPWLAASLQKAYVAAKRISEQDLREVVALKIGLPWIAQEVADTRALMGDDFWPYGVEPNRVTLEALARYSYEQGLAVRRLTVEEMFVPTTLSEPKT